MAKKFALWIEERINTIEDTVLGIISGNTPATDDQEKSHLLQRSTNEFSNEILEKLINLGIIRNIVDQDPRRYYDIVKSIKAGIPIRDLIEKINGPTLAPRAEIR